jgi:hypothetical protein
MSGRSESIFATASSGHARRNVDDFPAICRMRRVVCFVSAVRRHLRLCQSESSELSHYPFEYFSAIVFAV